MAAELAAHLPDRVRTLSLLSPFGFWSEDHPTVDFATIPGPSFGSQLARGNESLVPSPDGDPDRRTEEAIELSQALTSALKFLWGFPDQGLTKRIHRVSCPSVVVWGGDDDINPPAYADQFAAALPGSRVELLDGGHLRPYEQPEQVSKLVHEFALSR